MGGQLSGFGSAVCYVVLCDCAGRTVATRCWSAKLPLPSLQTNSHTHTFPARLSPTSPTPTHPQTPLASTGSEDRGLVYQTDAEASVLTAIRDMFLGQPDGGQLVHRLAIFDAHGDITRIVSQSDVLRCVCECVCAFGGREAAQAGRDSCWQADGLGSKREGRPIVLSKRAGFRAPFLHSRQDKQA